MPDVPGLDADVYFGEPSKPLPDWRGEGETEDTDEASPEDRAAVKGVLGFDPHEIDEPDAERRQYSRGSSRPLIQKILAIRAKGKRPS
jgi:hypothetical protein